MLPPSGRSPLNPRRRGSVDPRTTPRPGGPGRSCKPAPHWKASRGVCACSMSHGRAFRMPEDPIFGSHASGRSRCTRRASYLSRSTSTASAHSGSRPRSSDGPSGGGGTRGVGGSDRRASHWIATVLAGTTTLALCYYGREKLASDHRRPIAGPPPDRPPRYSLGRRTIRLLGR